MWSTRGMGLFVQTDPVGQAEAGLGLTVHGASQSGAFAGLDLTVTSDASGNARERTMPLFVQVSDVGESTRNMNLWVRGGTYNAAASQDLVLWNAESGAWGSLYLFVQGEGENDGWAPAERTMPLFLQRPTAGALPLFLLGPGTPSASGLSMVLHGAHGVASGLPLSLPDVVGFVSSGVPLFVRGW